MATVLFEVGTPARAARHRLANARWSPAWDLPEVPEPKIHQIHPYPAKFPAFLATRAFAYAKEEGIDLRRTADIFCGCGTVAYEARRQGLEFWGCDINPVATMIARAKSGQCRPARMAVYAASICRAFDRASRKTTLAAAASTRLRYWFAPQQFADLARLLNAINAVVPPRSEYRTAFHCAFSAILKSTSRWQQRSIKPAFDASKSLRAVLPAFRRQCQRMTAAWADSSALAGPKAAIHTENVMTIEPPEGGVDMILTSPPYVTSYEYADLHQLSSLWLGYAADYRDLRRGSIGSSQTDLNFVRAYRHLNRVGTQVVFSLFAHDAAIARSVASYYLDMQHVAARCLTFLRSGGIAIFVIGNTQYGGVHVDNAAHLAEALLQAGFSRVRATKRRVSNKSHTPFRDPFGRFTCSQSAKHIYSEEFILIAHK